MPSKKIHKSEITKIANSQEENQKNREDNIKLSEEIKKLTQDKQNLITENQNNITENQNLRTEIQNLKSTQQPNTKMEIDKIKITLVNFIKGYLTMLIFGLVKPYYKCCVYNFPRLLNARNEEYNLLIKKSITSFNYILQLIEKQDPFLIKINLIENELNDPTTFVSRYINKYMTSKNKPNDEIKNAEEQLVDDIFMPIYAHIIKYDIHDIENISLKMNQKQLKESSTKSNKIYCKTILKEKAKRKEKNVKEIDSTSTVCTNPSLNTANINEKMNIKKKENSLIENITCSNTTVEKNRSAVEKNFNNIHSNILYENNIKNTSSELKNLISSSNNAVNINSELIKVNNINKNKMDQSNINSSQIETKSTNANSMIDANNTISSIVDTKESISIVGISKGLKEVKEISIEPISVEKYNTNSSIVANPQSKPIDGNNTILKNAEENEIDSRSIDANTKKSIWIAEFGRALKKVKNDNTNPPIVDTKKSTSLLGIGKALKKIKADNTNSLKVANTQSKSIDGNNTISKNANKNEIDSSSIDTNNTNSSIMANNQCKLIGIKNANLKKNEKIIINSNSVDLNTTINNSPKENNSQSNGNIKKNHPKYSKKQSEQLYENLISFFYNMVKPKSSKDIDPALLELFDEAQSLTNKKIILKTKDGKFESINFEIPPQILAEKCFEALENRILKNKN